MTPSMPLTELKSKLSVAADETQRRLFFAALLRAEAGVPVDDFIVVGGSAIEIYTVGKYTSGDIDIVSSEDEKIGAVLRSWQFEKGGRVWVSETLQIVVDLVKHPYTGSAERTTVGATPFGPVRIAAIEDLLVKRLSSYKHWKEKGDYAHAMLLALQFRDTLDWPYVEKFGKEHDVGELVAAIKAAAAKSKAAQGF